MHLTDRFLNLVQQQLISYEDDQNIDHLVVYVARSNDGNSPRLEVVGEWPASKKVLQPVESDPELRAPSSNRRWYPLQEGSILLGVLRAERVPSTENWPEYLDKRLQSTAIALGHCLGLEFDRNRLNNELAGLKDQIGAMVHQLRNPLAALRTYAQLLIRKIGTDSDHINLIQGLLSEQDQLNKYLLSLEQLSNMKLPSISEGSTRLLLPPLVSKESSIDVKSLIEPLIERASAKANLQNRLWKGPSSWPDWTEKVRSIHQGLIGEIVANLLENAFRYSPPSASIGLEISNNGICVWDSGMPINDKERERIFQKGFRGTSSSELPGSGLGLALARQLSQQLGGDLVLISTPFSFNSLLPKVGNAFVLTLPMQIMSEEEM